MCFVIFILNFFLLSANAANGYKEEMSNAIYSINSVEKAANALQNSFSYIQNSKFQEPETVEDLTNFCQEISSRADSKVIFQNNVILHDSDFGIIPSTLEDLIAMVGWHDIYLQRAIPKISRIVFTDNKKMQFVKRTVALKSDFVKIDSPFMSVSFPSKENIGLYAENWGCGIVSIQFTTLNKCEIELSLPIGENNPDYCAIVYEDGTVLGGKYDFLNKRISVKISKNGIYKVLDNRTYFFDLDNANKNLIKSVDNLASKCIMIGTEKNVFSPKKALSRAEAAALILRATSENSSADENNFIDVSIENWYYKTALIAQKCGILSGYPDGTFRGDNLITNSEFLTMISKILTGRSNFVTPNNPEMFLNFNDKDQIANWAKTDIAICQMTGIIPQNAENLLYPNDFVLRENAAIMIYNLYNKISPLIFNKNMFQNPIVETSVGVYPYLDTRSRILSDNMPKGSLYFNCDTFVPSASAILKLQNTISSYKSPSGFYAVSTDGKFSIGFNIDKQFETASTIKSSYALFAYKQIEKNEIDMDKTTKTYEKRFYHNRAGIIKNSPVGSVYTLRRLLYLMINISDNSAFLMIQDMFPIGEYNVWMEYMGFDKMILKNGMHYGFTTPREHVLQWNEIYRYSKESQMGQYYFDTLLNAKYNYVKTALNNKYTVAHKSGYTNKNYNDGAVVFLEKPYIISVLTNGSAEGGTASYLDSQYFKSVVNEVNNIMLEYIEFTKK